MHVCDSRQCLDGIHRPERLANLAVVRHLYRCGGVLSFISCVPSCLANPMTSQKIPSGKKSQAVLFYSGAIGTTVFQVQDSTGTLGGTYTVNVVAQ